METLVVPGTRIGNQTDSIAGDGVYEMNGHLYASRLGTVVRQRDECERKEFVQVYRSINSNSAVLPKVGSVIVGRVTKLTYQFANVDIMVIDNIPVRESFNGTIKAQDIRSFDRDTVDMSKCFGPGDIIKAEVISLGDAYSYYLSTAKNDLGVVFAESAGGKSSINY
eukprot:Partr_v1_DN28810_c2_g1_i5_m34281 putative exosome component 1